MAEELWSYLNDALISSRHYAWHLWGFTKELLVGENFDQEIQKALQEADLGVFALSSGFLNSPYIRNKELPAFLDEAQNRRIIPVQMKALSSNADLHGLQTRQIFRYKSPYWAGRAPHSREAWAIDLADEMHRVAQKYGLGK